MYMTISVENNEYWYDMANIYYTFSEKHTELIDTILITEHKNVIVDENYIKNPDYGVYYYEFGNNLNICNIGLIKKLIKKNNKEVTFYKAYVGKYLAMTKLHNCLDQFIINLVELNRNDDKDMVIVHSIDTSQDTPVTISLKKLCKKPRQNQLDVLNIISSHFVKEHDFNVKIMLSGKRGLGKSYIGRLVKKYFTVNALLFDDFNPSSVGVNINTVALKYATKYSPVIIIINEIDTYFDIVLNPRETFDSRLQHTKSKGEFHNMLDAIGSTPYVISIFTTENVDIYKIEKYQSFIRMGRVDLFITMFDNNSIMT